MILISGSAESHSQRTKQNRSARKHILMAPHRGGFFFDLSDHDHWRLDRLTINAPGAGARCQHVVEHIPHMSCGKPSKERAGTTAIIHRVRMWVCKALADQREMMGTDKAETALTEMERKVTQNIFRRTRTTGVFIAGVERLGWLIYTREPCICRETKRTKTFKKA